MRHTDNRVKRIAIIGGGITGLTAAFYLEKARRAGASLEYKLFEWSSRLGGALLTEQVDGCIVEGGADSFLTEKPWAIELCRELAIQDQLVASNDARRQTFIFHNQKLVPLPRGMVFFVPTDSAAMEKSALFSATSKRQIARETRLRPGTEAGDVSVADFVERHFGNEMLERVADPLLAGIYGGDARALSMRAVMPRFLDLEQQFGSLVRGLKRRPASAETPLFTSLKNGMQQLVESLAVRLDPQAVHTNAEVAALSIAAGKWRLVCGRVEEDFDAVIITSPAHAAASLLDPVSSALANLLRRIPYSSSVSVALGYSAEENAGKKLRALEGFGFLLPHKAGRRALACTFVHNKFSHRARADRALLRVFFGGVRDQGVSELDDKALVSLARRELAATVKLELQPRFFRVHRWFKATPQYNLGHCELVGQIETEAGRMPGLALAGSAYRGIGVPDCVREARDAASEVLARGCSLGAT